MLAEVGGAGAARTWTTRRRVALSLRSGVSSAVTPKAGARGAAAEGATNGTTGTAAARTTLADLAAARVLKKVGGAARTEAGAETGPLGEVVGVEELGLARSSRTKDSGRVMTVLLTTHRGDSRQQVTGECCICVSVCVFISLILAHRRRAVVLLSFLHIQCVFCLLQGLGWTTAPGGRWARLGAWWFPAWPRPWWPREQLS